MNVKITTEKMKIAMNATSYLELAKQLNITLPTIDSWKKRNTIPNKYLLKVSEDTGVSIDWLLDEDKPTFDIDKNKSTNSKSDNDIDENTLNLINTIYGFAKTNNRTVELKEDLKQLLNKYI